MSYFLSHQSTFYGSKMKPPVKPHLSYFNDYHSRYEQFTSAHSRYEKELKEWIEGAGVVEKQWQTRELIWKQYPLKGNSFFKSWIWQPIEDHGYELDAEVEIVENICSNMDCQALQDCYAATVGLPQHCVGKKKVCRILDKPENSAHSFTEGSEVPEKFEDFANFRNNMNKPTVSLIKEEIDGYKSQIAELKKALNNLVDATQDKNGQFRAWHQHLKNVTNEAKQTLNNTK